MVCAQEKNNQIRTKLANVSCEFNTFLHDTSLDVPPTLPSPSRPPTTFIDK